MAAVGVGTVFPCVALADMPTPWEFPDKDPLRAKQRRKYVISVI
jgi:hypothetical protein